MMSQGTQSSSLPLVVLVSSWGTGSLSTPALSPSWRPTTAWQYLNLPSCRSTINLWATRPITAIAGRCRFSDSAPMGSFDDVQVTPPCPPPYLSITTHYGHLPSSDNLSLSAPS